MHHMAVPTVTGHHTPVAVSASAGMHAYLKSGGRLQYRPSPRQGCSAPEVIPILSVIAARRAVVSFRPHRRQPLKTLANGWQDRLPVSAKGLHRQPRVSASGPYNRLRVSANSHCYRVRVSSRVLPRPVLPAKACSLPGHHQLPLAVTGEPTKPGDRVFVARQAARAVRRHILLLPPQQKPVPLNGKMALEGVLPPARMTPGVNRAGSMDR